MKEKNNQVVVEVGENVKLEGIIDAFGKNLAKKLQEYFGITIARMVFYFHKIFNL